jgi:hypothetical protein
MEGSSKELSSTFIIGVEGSQEEPSCKDATATFSSGTTDRTVSLGEVVSGQYDLQSINIDEPLKVSLHNMDGCAVKPTYLFLIKDESVSPTKWRQFDVMHELLIKEAAAENHFFSSWIQFDRTTGSFWSGWAAEDIAFLRTRFADHSITVRIAVYIGGSETQGADADYDSMAHTDFKIKFKAPEEVSGCANNQLFALYETYPGFENAYGIIERPDPMEFTIAKTGET